MRRVSGWSTRPPMLWHALLPLFAWVLFHQGQLATPVDGIRVPISVHTHSSTSVDNNKDDIPSVRSTGKHDPKAGQDPTAPILDTPFTQAVSTRYTWAASKPLADWGTLPFSNVEQVVSYTDGIAIVLTNTSLYIMAGGEFSQLSIPSPVMPTGTRLHTLPAVSSSTSTSPTAPVLAVVSSKYLYYCTVNISLHASPLVDGHGNLDVPRGASSLACTGGVSPLPWTSAVSSLTADQRGVLYIGTVADGLFALNNITATPTPLSQVSERNITTLAYSLPALDTLAIGTATRLYRVDLRTGRWRHFWVSGYIDANITSLAWDTNDNLWVGNVACINIQAKNLTFYRFSGVTGLPYGNITSLITSAWPQDAVWIGTTWGLLRYNDTGDARARTAYLNGPRYLPTPPGVPRSHITSLAFLTSAAASSNSNRNSNSHRNHSRSRSNGGPLSGRKSESVIAVTQHGLAVIEMAWWTLESKAKYLQAQVYPRHDRFGLTSDVGLKYFGNLTSYFQSDSDNDGLWTSIYLGSQCFRYAVTGEVDARDNAVKAFHALQLLNNVTGIRGFMARSVVKTGTPHQGGQWVNSTVMPGWTFKANTSSDEVTGHLFAYPTYLNLVAPHVPNSNETAQALQLITDITSYIMNPPYPWQLVNVGGLPTRWGVWDPTDLNDNINWSDDRGQGSIEMLTWLLSAYQASNDSQYLQAYDTLVAAGYDVNVINQKVTIPGDATTIDDNLGLLTYFLYLFTNPTQLREEMLLSIDRNYRIVKKERFAPWVFLAALAQAPSYHPNDMQDAAWCLRSWLHTMIYWPVHNSNRLDYRLDPEYAAVGAQQTTEKVFRYDESNVYRWGDFPLGLDGGDGVTEMEPSGYLLAYWIGRHLGYISPPITDID